MAAVAPDVCPDPHSLPDLGPIGFGGAAIGNLYSAVGNDEAAAAVDTALRLGIRYFDTAPYYGHGLSERRIGAALAGRTDVVISTKVGRLLQPSRGGRPDDGFAVDDGLEAVFDYSRDGVLRSLESSLTRLGRASVDILLLHDVGRATHGDAHPEMLRQALNEALPALADLKAQGVCRAVGIGVNEEAVCLEVMRAFDVDAILLAGRYTLLDQASLDGVLAEARRRSVAIIAGGPYNSGILAPAGRPGGHFNYAEVPPDIHRQAARIYEICHRRGVDPGAAAVQFPLAHPAVATVVAGMRTADEVASAVARAHAAIPAALWADLRSAGLIASGAPTP